MRKPADEHWRRERIDIGHSHEISYYTANDDAATHTGLIDWHLTPDGLPCSGSILFDMPQNADASSRARWQVISEDPLTLSPSLLCMRCGDHGWIRGGAWEPA